MTFLTELERLKGAATKGPWQRTGVARIEGVTLNGILRQEDADLICHLRNHADALAELVRAAGVCWEKREHSVTDVIEAVERMELP